MLIDALLGARRLRRRPDARWRATADDIESPRPSADRPPACRGPAGPARRHARLFGVHPHPPGAVEVVAACRDRLDELGFVPGPSAGGEWRTFGDAVEILEPTDAHDGMCGATFRRRPEG
ncbi:MAG: hypothetical protein R2695_18250 [Acidimicrobiales bacterium]